MPSCIWCQSSTTGSYTTEGVRQPEIYAGSAKQLTGAFMEVQGKEVYVARCGVILPTHQERIEHEYQCAECWKLVAEARKESEVK